MWKFNFTVQYLNSNGSVSNLVLADWTFNLWKFFTYEWTTIRKSNDVFIFSGYALRTVLTQTKVIFHANNTVGLLQIKPYDYIYWK